METYAVRAAMIEKPQYSVFDCDEIALQKESELELIPPEWLL
jgi:hypothetical protein